MLSQAVTSSSVRDILNNKYNLVGKARRAVQRAATRFSSYGNGDAIANKL